MEPSLLSFVSMLLSQNERDADLLVNHSVRVTFVTVIAAVVVADVEQVSRKVRKIS